MNGVPIAEVTANDFMQVRAALVRRVGGADAALVFARIYYRTDKNSRVAIEVEGEMWWTASHPLLSRETGLTEGQARKAAQDLVDGGFVEAQKLHGNVLSYRPIVIGHLLDSTDSASVESSRSIGSIEQVHLSDSTVAPLIDIEDVKDTPVVPKGTSELQQVWEMWPSSRRGAWKKAESSWRTATKVVGSRRTGDLVVAARQFCERWATWPAAEVRFVPLLTTWLNQERWTTPLPEPRRAVGTVEHGRQVDEILRAREERLAVGS